MMDERMVAWKWMGGPVDGEKGEEAIGRRWVDDTWLMHGTWVQIKMDRGIDG